MHFSRFSPRLITLLHGFLFLLSNFAIAFAQPDAASVSNGDVKEIAAVLSSLNRLDTAVAARDANTLRFFGIEEIPPLPATLQAQTRATHIAFSPAGALVRQAFRISSGDANAAGSTLASGIHEFWLARGADGNFNFTDKHWVAPYDANTAFQKAAREAWNIQSSTKINPLLHLVATRRAGRWIALRFSRWDGQIFDARNMERIAATQTVAPGDAFDAKWLQSQMQSAPEGEAGTGHFLFQKGRAGWIGVGMAWEEDRRISPQNDARASAARRDILGASYASPDAHRALGLALWQLRLVAESTQELEKADALQPGIVSAAIFQQVRAAKARDPEAQAISQLENERRVGLDPNHPTYLISALMKDFENQPSILRALRLGLEYSRLGDDALAAERLRDAQEMVGQGALKNLSDSDSQWIQVLSEHLEERRVLSSLKPTNTIRSQLFNLRCWPNDPASVQVLASLEAAQHTVYADFGIPMGSTEVLLWRTQSEFQRYVTRFSAQGNSEFVAALTLTKLIGTREGPVVLGEEINVFNDARMGVFSTVAHEYGHVAVRQLSRGRDVPTWFNEGVATAVEGGYDGYIERVREAAKSRSLLPMGEMLEWDVDGERAFLAYSQANSLIDYIVATWGKDAVLNILRRIGTDENPDAAFQSALGISQQELWRRWARDGIR